MIFWNLTLYKEQGCLKHYLRVFRYMIEAELKTLEGEGFIIQFQELTLELKQRVDAL